MSRNMRIGIAALFVIGVVAWLFMPPTPSRTTDTYSSQFASDEQKIAFLGKYLNLPSKIEAAEFHVVYHDNSGSFAPGPSDWTIEAAVKLAPDSIPLWISGMEIQETQDISWGHALIAGDQEKWDLQSRPLIYKQPNENVFVAVFEKEGVLFKSISTR